MPWASAAVSSATTSLVNCRRRTRNDPLSVFLEYLITLNFALVTFVQCSLGIETHKTWLPTGNWKPALIFPDRRMLRSVPHATFSVDECHAASRAPASCNV